MLAGEDLFTEASARDLAAIRPREPHRRSRRSNRGPPRARASSARRAVQRQRALRPRGALARRGRRALPGRRTFSRVPPPFAGRTPRRRGSGLAPQEGTMIPEQVFVETLLAFLDPIRSYLDDPSVSEIMINGPDKVYVEKKGKLERIDARFPNDEALMAALRNVAQYTGKQVDEFHPILEARLPDGSRVQAVVPPASFGGATVAIRRFSRALFAIERLIDMGALTTDAASTLGAVVIRARSRAHRRHRGLQGSPAAAGARGVLRSTASRCEGARGRQHPRSVPRHPATSTRSHRHRRDTRWGSARHHPGHGERTRRLHGDAARHLSARHADQAGNDGLDERRRDSAARSSPADRVGNQHHRAGGSLPRWV